MPAPVTIWLEISHHAAFRVGGWAFVRRDAAGIAGHAGGERRVEAERAALAGLIAALAGEPAGAAPVRILATSHLVAAIPERIRAAETGEGAPAENLELWAQAMRLLAARPVEIVAASPAERPTAFAAAWAEQARDRAKDKGDFAAAIPKPNLARSGAWDRV
jgi:hypothetical protein